MRWWQEIKDKNCKHGWVKLHKKITVWFVIFWYIYDIDYLHCPKCGSSTADETGTMPYNECKDKGRLR